MITTNSKLLTSKHNIKENKYMQKTYIKANYT